MLTKITTAALCAAAVAAGVARAETAAPPVSTPAYDIQTVYEVTLLGFSVGTIQMDLKLHDGLYEVHAYVRPDGLASMITANTVNAVANGLGALGAVTPNSSWIQQISSKRTQTVTIQYQDGDPVSMVADPVYEINQWTPAEALTKGTYDPMSAVLAMMLIPTAGPGEKACGTSIPIYDGKRVYAFDMWSDGMTDVKRGAGGYNGEALHCVVGYRRIAGWDAEHIAKASNTKIEVLFAPIGKGANGGPAFYLPVRLWSNAEVGDVVAVPTRVTINGKDWGQFFAEGG